MLAGDGNEFDDKKEVHSLLPPSLIELEVYFDDGPEFPFICNRKGPSARPVWLFGLLAHKTKHSSKIKLERLRISSHKILPDPVDEIYLEHWNIDYEMHDDDWDEDDGHHCWKPHMELIGAFKKAEVSFGIYLQPSIGYKFIVPDGTWFADCWED